MNENLKTEEIKQLIIDKEYNKALEMMDEALTNPLTSLKAQEELRLWKKALLDFFELKNTVDGFKKLSKKEMLKNLVANNFDCFILELFFEENGNNLDENDLRTFEILFCDSEISNYKKVKVIEALSEFKLDYSVKFTNSSLLETSEVKLDNEISFENSVVNEIKTKIDKVFFKEPSKANNAKHLLESIYYSYFNNFDLIPYSVDDLVGRIKDYIEKSYEGIAINDNEFEEWINNVSSISLID